jgi:RNA polymerase sigma-70 factor (ECF subfamily)
VSFAGIGGRCVGPARVIWSAAIHTSLGSDRMMSPKRATDSQGEGTPTLGDLLYADPSTAAIREDDWAGLVASIAGGDQQALRALYERTHRLVFTLVMRICGNREMADELTVDVFHDVWRRSGQYDPADGSVVGWIMIQARSRAIDRLRFEQRKKRGGADRPDPGSEQVEVSGPANVIEAQQRGSQLREALAELTPDERQTIETAFFSELTYSETAARLDQPLGTVKTRVRSALAKLRKALGSGGDQR